MQTLCVKWKRRPVSVRLNGPCGRIRTAHTADTVASPPTDPPVPENGRSMRRNTPRFVSFIRSVMYTCG